MMKIAIGLIAAIVCMLAYMLCLSFLLKGILSKEKRVKLNQEDKGDELDEGGKHDEDDFL